MDIKEMASNECVSLEKGEDLHLTKLQMLEISEAINHLDCLISELELALDINNGQSH